MVRTSHAFFAGMIAMFLVAMISFLGGWTAAQTVGNIPLSTFVTTTVLNRTGDGSTPAEIHNQFAIFWDVWDIVQSEFYHTEPLDQQKMVYGAIHGMLDALNDDYTVFQEPEAAERSRESMQGKFEGIGIYMNFVDGQVIVERPIKGSPAMEAGLLNGDIIIGVDGQEVAALIEGMNETEATDTIARLVRGPKGSMVHLTIYRPADESTFEVNIIRDEVPLISVYGQMLDNNIAYIQITEFKATTTEEFSTALRELLPRQPAGLVLDLRNNPGGFLTTAQEVLGHFYDGIALYEETSDGTIEEFSTIQAARDVRIADMPIVVLINGNSASASEIVAGALRDQRPNTVLLGETSFGKGSVQNIHRLSDGSSVRITMAHWFTPNRDEIHGIGITPQYVVPDSQDPQYAVPCIEGKTPPEGQPTCSDAQLSWGLQFLLHGTVPPPPEPEQ